jgi:hypothetical protein
MRECDTDAYRSRVPAWLEFWLLLALMLVGLGAAIVYLAR